MITRPIFLNIHKNIAGALTKPITRRNMVTFYPHTNGII